MLQPRHNWVAGVVCGSLVAAIGALLLSFVGSGLHSASYDYLFLFRKFIKPTEAVVVYMDDQSHDILGQSLTGLWDRNLHARLVERLTKAGAKVIVFDIHFSGPGENPEATTNFARAIKVHGAVVLGVDSERVTSISAGGPRAILPYELLADAAAELGSVETRPDNDLVFRRHLSPGRDDFFPPLSWAAAKVFGAPPSQAERWINHYGPPGTLPHCSYYRAADEPDEFFRGKTVFVGARLLTKLAGERKDEFESPYGRWRKNEPFISGVEAQATMFLNLVRADWLTRLSPWTELKVLVAFGFLTGFGLLHLRPWVAAGVALLLAGVGAGIAYLLFKNSFTWFPWLIPVAVQLPIALALAVLYNSFQLYVQNRLLEQSLARHLSPARVKQMLKRPELLQPGAEKQLLTIMFTDIADFTKLAEGMDSDELAKLMNSYFEQAISCVHETDGFLVKLIGDALFAIWNAPIAQSDHQQRALKTALLLQERLVQFPAMRTRVGIHTGVADVGNFGSSTRFDYTAIGENINLASRLEGLNKHLGTTVLLSETAQSGAGDLGLTRYVGRFRLKGFEKAVEVFELIGQRDQAEETCSWREAFAEGVNQFHKRNWDAAETCFCKVLKIRAADGPATFYLARINELRSQELPATWQGEIELTEK
jgi:adenylate cyclase